MQKNAVFKWTPQCNIAFNIIKKELSSDRNLIHYNSKLPIKIICYASKEGLGAVLLHVLPNGQEKPIGFASRTLTKAESGYSVIHKEALAIYWAVQKFRQYLLGNKFVLCSDHKPLLALFGEGKGVPLMGAARLQRWALNLSGFDYSLEYIKGLQNGGADGLSRLALKVNQDGKSKEEPTYINFFELDEFPMIKKDINLETRRDLILGKIYYYTEIGWPSGKLEIDDDLRVYFTHIWGDVK